MTPEEQQQRDRTDTMNFRKVVNGYVISTGGKSYIFTTLEDALEFISKVWKEETK